MISLMDRFMLHVKKTDSCWLWIGHKGKHGYGMMRKNYKFLRVHRVSYELFVGPIPEGKHVLHHCDNTLCVNPDHLFLGTQKDNMIDMKNKGRSTKGRVKEKCIRGHRLEGDNLYIKPNGDRECRECKKFYRHRYERKAV